MFILIAVLDFILLNDKILVFLGLLAGSTFGIIKFGMWAILLSKFFLPSYNGAVIVKSIVIFLLLFGGTALLLIISILINISLLIGVTEGVLLVPFTAFFLSLVGGAGIKKNDFIK
ncbi:hypothetical protein [Pseudobacteroides cellulosolvens]|uniref:hypothetical protein n=1 Tax=Pseudobacteroides cellulosolvens TaxID=35825 RepID=UPI001A9A4B03|nr:hypothetical protein [Pseudobacteroides cellulosolvens]